MRKYFFLIILLVGAGIFSAKHAQAEGISSSGSQFMARSEFGQTIPNIGNPSVGPNAYVNWFAVNLVITPSNPLFGADINGFLAVRLTGPDSSCLPGGGLDLRDINYPVIEAPMPAIINSNPACPATAADSFIFIAANSDAAIYSWTWSAMVECMPGFVPDPTPFQGCTVPVNDPDPGMVILNVWPHGSAWGQVIGREFPSGNEIINCRWEGGPDVNGICSVVLPFDTQVTFQAINLTGPFIQWVGVTGGGGGGNSDPNCGPVRMNQDRSLGAQFEQGNVCCAANSEIIAAPDVVFPSQFVRVSWANFDPESVDNWIGLMNEGDTNPNNWIIRFVTTGTADNDDQCTNNAGTVGAAQSYACSFQMDVGPGVYEFVGFFMNVDLADPDWVPDNTVFRVPNKVTVVDPFQPLRVIKSGGGNGTITSTPAGINCGNACPEQTVSFDYGQVVTLEVAANPGSTFTGWAGEGCGGVGICTVTMSKARTVTASFDAVPTLITDPATNPAPNSVTLNGRVDPNLQATNAWFRYSTVNPGSCDALFDNDANGPKIPFAAGSGNGYSPYSQNLIGLIPDTTYYYCAIGSNNTGFGYGTIVSFVTKASGTIIVNTNVATDWQLNGPQPANCNACSNDPSRYTNWIAGNYSLTNVPNFGDYAPPQINPALGVFQNLPNGGTITWTIYYPPKAPIITDVVNSTCEQLTVSWNDVLSEASYEVWRTEDEPPNAFPIGWIKIADSPANNPLSYTDNTVVANNSYYYIIVAKDQVGSTPSAPFGSRLAVQCFANLTSSVKTIDTIQKPGVRVPVPFNMTMKIEENDILKFKITIINNGTDDADITKFCDYPSNNFQDLNNASEDGPLTSPAARPLLNPVECEVINGNPGYYFDVDGTLTKDGANSRSDIYFTAVFRSQSPNLKTEICSNLGRVIYNDSSGNGKIEDIPFGPTLCQSAGSRVPTFREVAP